MARKVSHKTRRKSVKKWLPEIKSRKRKKHLGYFEESFSLHCKLAAMVYNNFPSTIYLFKQKGKVTF